MAHEFTERDIRKGFWYYRPDEHFPPMAVTRPEEYDGSPRLNVACTQTSLGSHAQRKLVDHWCQFLPTCRNLEFLWFSSKVPADLFEAACRVPRLRGLWIKRSGIQHLDSLTRAVDLRFLHLGSSTQVKTIQPLGLLKRLEWLEVENFKKIHDISDVGKLHNLQGLAIEGSMWGTQVVEALEPLSRLRQLRHLSIANLRARDKTLAPLFDLPQLQHFHSALWWDEKERAHLEQLCLSRRVSVSK